jgi:eukaryotic-like serine/threonine-protein kinase
MRESPSKVAASRPRLLPFESLLEQFEDEWRKWRARRPPRIEGYLRVVATSDQPTLLRELLAIELYWRRHDGQALRPEDYLARFPQHPLPIQQAFAELSTPSEAKSRTEDVKVPLRPTAEWRAGEVAAHFELLKKAGKGTFGTVWKARDIRLDRVVALKIPHGGVLHGEAAERFKRDARLAAKMDHPNLVTIYEASFEAHPFYIASRFIEGVTLAKAIDGRPMDASRATGLARTLAAALHYAHQSGVIHRDVKPGNIILDAEGRPTLVDFGLGKGDGGAVQITGPGAILGSAAYMSPEQAKGEGYKADHRSDIYSLGVVLYEMLTGRCPFQGKSVRVLDAVRSEEPPRPSALRPGLSPALEAVCFRCLRKEPAERFQTAAELSVELMRLSDRLDCR